MARRARKITEHDVHGEIVRIMEANGSSHATRVVELLPKLQSTPGLMVEVGALLVTCCLCDENGVLIYDDPEKAKAEESLGFLLAFIEPALEASGLGEDAAEIRKNSPAVQ